MTDAATLCENCRFWMDITPPDGWSRGAEFEGFGALGECRRNPPAFNFAGAIRPDDEDRDEDGPYLDWLYARHPITAPDHWCGEFRQRPT